MTSTLVDSNIILDVTEGNDWSDWSGERMREGLSRGTLLINPIVYAEVSCRFTDQRRIDAVLSGIGIGREELLWDAAHRAGQAHAQYRKAGGQRERTLPDFLIGAHAAVRRYTLLTRDARRYRAYFPDVDIVAPDSHP